MDTFNEILRWAQNAVFVAIGVWALREWLRRKNVQAGWLAATFGSLAAVVIAGIYTDAAAPDSAPARIIGIINLAIIAFFPYFLLRFLDTFEPQGHRLKRVALGASALVAAGGLALYNQLPEEGQAWTPVVAAWVLAFVLDWFIVLALVGWRFWRGGRGQPTLARRRLRLLALASVLLGLVLLIAGAAGGDPSPTTTLITRVIGLVSALTFLIGFAPPGTLRTAWRQPEEQRLHEASLLLMAAESREQVGEILAPHMTAVVGAEGVAIIDHDDVVGHDGIRLPEARAAALSDDHEDALQVDLTNGRILVWTNRYTPFFGEEEITLLRRLGLLADLALDRTALLGAEKEARHELELTNKELEAFVYTASHDLKSPLIAMLGYLEVIETEYRDRLGEEGDWYVERMLTNGRYMESLIGDLLELSRVGRMQTDPELVDIKELTDGLASELGARYPNASYEVGELPRLWINPTRARQLIGNLMENAAKYGGEDLTVTIESHALTDGGVELRVADDGVGIPEAYAEKIFGVFERLDPDDTKSGTGIGLAICRKIVDATGGHIWLAPSERGADFRIRFPADIVRDAPPPAAGDATTASDPETGRATSDAPPHQEITL